MILFLAENPKDECECGDWRRNHPDNGPCEFKSHNIPDPDYDVCSKFRLAKLSEPAIPDETN